MFILIHISFIVYTSLFSLLVLINRKMGNYLEKNTVNNILQQSIHA